MSYKKFTKIDSDFLFRDISARGYNLGIDEALETIDSDGPMWHIELASPRMAVMPVKIDLGRALMCIEDALLLSKRSP